MRRAESLADRRVERALKRFDANDDGWLASFDASRAADALREVADSDCDGRVTMSEYDAAVALIAARTPPISLSYSASFVR